MTRPSVHLTGHHRRMLEALAAADRVSVDDLLERAVDDYVARRRAEDAAWAARFDRLVERLRAAIPPDGDVAEIDADVTAAIAEVRQARRAAFSRCSVGIPTARTAPGAG